MRRMGQISESHGCLAVELALCVASSGKPSEVSETGDMVEFMFCQDK